MVTSAAPVHISRLELRHRALALQRRRFWREFSYGSILVAADVLTVAAVFALLGMAPLGDLYRVIGEGGESFVRGLLPQTPVALIRRVTSLLFCLIVTRCYADVDRRQYPGRIFAALLLGLVLPRWVELWATDQPARWGLVGFALLATWAAMVLQRRGIAEALKPIDPRRLDPERTLIVGPPGDVERLRTAREGDKRSPLRSLVIAPEWPSEIGEGMREMYGSLAESDADAVVLVGTFTDAALQAVMFAASSAGASVYATRREAFRLFDEPSFVLRRAEPLSVLSRPALVGSQLVAKRVLDLTGAVLGMVVLSPVFAVVSLLVAATSRGPVFFRQTRVGLGGDPFQMIKFRTMVHDAEQRQAALQEANQYSGDPLFKLARDPRTTSIGVFLRRSSLDELPQLLNVLRGEMSLVGPRPALPSEVQRYQQHHFIRFEVLPGMTGPWQVSGRNTIKNFEDVVRLESDYIRGWTVSRDLVILLRTVPAVLSMKGAF
jgi:exopolysaccharide biosynthesis polyprenyl glycosylphosphotransferase